VDWRLPLANAVAPATSLEGVDVEQGDCRPLSFLLTPSSPSLHSLGSAVLPGRGAQWAAPPALARESHRSHCCCRPSKGGASAPACSPPEGPGLSLGRRSTPALLPAAAAARMRSLSLCFSRRWRQRLQSVPRARCAPSLDTQSAETSPSSSATRTAATCVPLMVSTRSTRWRRVHSTSRPSGESASRSAPAGAAGSAARGRP